MAEGRFLNNIEQGRFEYHLTDGFAFGRYKIAGNVLILQQVEVPEELRGRGIASKVMEEIMDFMQSRHKSKGLKIQPFCSYARSWLEKHPEFHDITEF